MFALAWHRTFLSAPRNPRAVAKKTKVTTWVSRDALRALRDVAAAHRLTVSQVAAEILERGLKERAETAGLGLLGPAVEGVVKREVGRMSDRLAHLTSEPPTPQLLMIEPES